MKSLGTRNHILDKLRDKVSSSAYRKDISVVDYTTVNDNSARIIAIHRGEDPSFEDVRGWVTNVTNGRLRIIADTLASYDTMPYPMLSFVAELNEKRKPFSQAMKETSMVCIAKNTYLDENLGTTWEKRTIEGRSFLVRVDNDGVDKVLQTVAKYSGPKTSKIARQIIAMPACPKDKVVYLRPDSSVGNGTVVSIDDRGFMTIKDDSTHNVYERTQGTILDIVREGSNSKGKTKEMIDYYSTYMGEDLAKRMFD